MHHTPAAHLDCYLPVMLMPVELLVAKLLDDLWLGQGLHHLGPRSPAQMGLKCLSRPSRTGKTRKAAAEQAQDAPLRLEPPSPASFAAAALGQGMICHDD